MDHLIQTYLGVLYVDGIYGIFKECSTWGYDKAQFLESSIIAYVI